MKNNFKSNTTTAVALITGGAKRIGEAITRSLHANGYNVIIHYRHSKQEALTLCNALNQSRNHSACIIYADFNHPNAYHTLIQEAASQWGHLNVLINNASAYFETPIGKTEDQDWNQLMNSNLKAPYFLAQAAAFWLQKTKGTIINLSDMHAKHPKKNYSVYCIAKAGLNMLTKTLAKELGPEISVNGIAPMTTLWADKPNTPSATIKNNIIEQTLLKKITRLNDVISTIHFLIQQKSLTGETIHLDCGKLLFPF